MCACYQFVASQLQIHPSFLCFEILEWGPVSISLLPADTVVTFVDRAP